MGLYVEPLFDVIDVWSGKTFTRTYAVTDGAGGIVPLTGAEIRFMVRSQKADTDPVLYLFRDNGLVIDDAMGTISIAGSPTNATDLCDALSRGWGHMGIEIAFLGGDTVPYMEGKIVTHTSSVR